MPRCPLDRTLFISRLIGPAFVIIAAGMLINVDLYNTMIAEALHPVILLYLSGVLSMIAGLAIVNLHNRWRAHWSVIITVLGWLMTFGGAVRIVGPQVAIAIGDAIYRGRTSIIVMALVVGLVGAFLCYKSYMRGTDAP